MTGKTHLSTGILGSLLLCNNIYGGILLSFGSILPDIDHHNSFLGKNIPLFSKLFKHRGFTHSLLFAFMLWFIEPFICYGILIHIFFDLMTRNGVALLSPLTYKFRFPFAKYISTGKWFERILCILIYLIILLVLIKMYL